MACHEEDLQKNECHPKHLRRMAPVASKFKHQNSRFKLRIEFIHIDMEKDKQVTLDTYKKIVPQYIEHHDLNADNVKSLEHFTQLVGTGKILDVGCSDGLESDYLNSRGFQVTGIDLSEDFIKYAKQTYPNCKFEIMDMEKLSYSDCEFDGIWASASFIHIPKERAIEVLKGFRRILKPTGTLFVSVKYGNLNRLWKNNTWHWGERHFSHYSQKGLRLFLVKSGFTTVEIIRNYNNWGNSWLHAFAS